MAEINIIIDGISEHKPDEDVDNFEVFANEKYSSFDVDEKAFCWTFGQDPIKVMNGISKIVVVVQYREE